MTYVHTPAWYERLDRWVDHNGTLDAGYRLFSQFERKPMNKVDKACAKVKRNRDGERAAELVNKLRTRADELEKGSWVKCKDRLPAEGKDVLLGRVGDADISMGYLMYGKWWCHGDGDDLEVMPVTWESSLGPCEYFTHWMPLPASPTE